MLSPYKGEHRDDFIMRFMSNIEARISFPKDDERIAFCHSEWERHAGAKEIMEDVEVKQTVINKFVAKGSNGFKIFSKFGEILNYDPDEARKPAGDPEGGEWTTDSAPNSNAAFKNLLKGDYETEQQFREAYQKEIVNTGKDRPVGENKTGGKDGGRSGSNDQISQSEKDKLRQSVDDYLSKYSDRFGLAPWTSTNVVLDETRSKAISDAYDAMVSDPTDPKVKAAYAQLAKEVDAQYNYLVNTVGLKVIFTDDDPYKTSRDMVMDVVRNNQLRVYKGGEDHPLLGSNTTDKNGITANEKFRAVHDYFGHSIEQNQFGKLGEERAWVAHSKMFSPLAQSAVTTETRGQNSWVNFSGANADALKKMSDGNRMIKAGDKEAGRKLVAQGQAEFKFAQQKVGLLPAKYYDYKTYATPSPTVKHEWYYGEMIDEKIKNFNVDEARVPAGKEGGGRWMSIDDNVAPNGEPSNLKPDVYDLVRTDDFKKWFGDWQNDPKHSSKILDKNGEPWVVYHGTKSDFSEFNLEKAGSNNDPGMWGTGFYFSPIKNMSLAYGDKVLDVFLSIKNPFIVKAASKLPDEFKPGGGKLQFDKNDSDALRQRFIKAGYDGVIQYETGEKPKLTQIVAFYPDQIKLADGSNTTFDKKTKDIRHEFDESIHNKAKANKFILTENPFELVTKSNIKNDFDEQKHPRVPAGSGDPSGEFASKQTTEAEAEANMKGFEKGANKFEKDAIHDYSYLGFLEINSGLRKNIPLDKIDPAGSIFMNEHGVKPTIEAIDKFLDEAPKVAMTSYRGINFFNPKDYESFKNLYTKGTTITDKAFASTTLNKTVMEYFERMGYGNRYRIELTMNGHNGVYLNGVSATPVDKEVLYPRNSMWRIVDTKETSDEEGTMLHVTLDEIGGQAAKVKNWNEELHPRVPAGHGESSGEFASKFGYYDIATDNGKNYKQIWPNVTIHQRDEVEIDKQKIDEYLGAIGLPKNFEGQVDFTDRGTIDDPNKKREMMVIANGDGLNEQIVFGGTDYTKATQARIDYLKIDSDSKYNGHGAEILKNSIDTLGKLGYRKMTVTAIRMPNANGYYTFGRFGFTPVNDTVAKIAVGEKIDAYNKRYGTNVRNLPELLGTRIGQDYWKANGVGWNGEFDVREGSANRKLLDNYFQSKHVHRSVKNKLDDNEAQLQLDEYRKTGIPYYDPYDEAFMDFSQLMSKSPVQIVPIPIADAFKKEAKINDSLVEIIKAQMDQIQAMIDKQKSEEQHRLDKIAELEKQLKESETKNKLSESIIDILKQPKEVKVIEIDGVKDYDPNEQRIPAGQGEHGGEWTDSFSSAGGNKVVDAFGNPLTVYHVTTEKFKKFNFSKTAQGIVWFTDSLKSIYENTTGAGLRPNQEQIIMERQIKIDNPAGWDEYEKYGIGQLKDKGYDGVILPQEGNEKYYIVFSNNQIRVVPKRKIKSELDENIERAQEALEDLEERAKEIIAEWDESKHPRVPAGQGDPSGEFANEAMTSGEAENKLAAMIPDIRPDMINLKGLSDEESGWLMDVFRDEGRQGFNNYSNALAFVRTATMSDIQNNPSAIAFYGWDSEHKKGELVVNPTILNYFQYRQAPISYEEQLQKLQERYDGLVKDSGNQADLRNLQQRIDEIKNNIQNHVSPLIYNEAQQYKNEEDRFKAVVYHEMGHMRLREEYINGENNGAIPRGIDYVDWKKDMLGKSFKDNPVSEYGKTNTDEYFAECYALYKMGKDNEVPPKVLEFIKGITSKRSGN